MDIIICVMNRQTRDNLSDSQLAAILGIHRVSWQRIKHHHARFGRKFLAGVNRAYPDIFLSSKVSSCNTTGYGTHSSLIDKATKLFRMRSNR